MMKKDGFGRGTRAEGVEMAVGSTYVIIFDLVATLVG